MLVEGNRSLLRPTATNAEDSDISSGIPDLKVAPAINLNVRSRLILWSEVGNVLVAAAAAP